MKFDAYSMKARFAPALTTIAIPIVIFNYFFIGSEFAQFVGYMQQIKFLSSISISFICLYYLSEVGRMLGKGVFESTYFQDELHMPTTNFMLFKDDTYSDEYKSKMKNRIQEDFSLALNNREQEELDEKSARKKIVEAMALVRKKLHKNSFLLQHNIEYGAMRNLIGGAVIGYLLCFVNIYVFRNIVSNELAVSINSALLCLYFLPVLFSKPIINFYGRNYAKILFREYMG